MALGSIVVDLMMRTGAFEEGAANAERVAKRRAAAIDQAFADMGRNVAIAAGAAGAALVAMTAQMTQQANDIINLARVSGATTEEFQRMAAAAKSVGVEQDQLGDMFKDFREKIGEFVSTGGGEMKDFFEQIADKAGVTAESFRHLSGPQALQLYVTSLEKAGLSTEQMSFYLESAANDTTKLIPILQSGGAAAKTLGDEAAKTGRIMNEDLLKATQQIGKDMDTFKGILEGLRNAVIGAVLPSVNDLGGGFLKLAQEVGFAQAALVSFGGVVARTLNIDELGKLNKEATAARLNVASLGRQLETATSMPFGMGDSAAASIRSKMEAEMKRAGELSARIKALTGTGFAEPANVPNPFAGAPAALATPGTGWSRPNVEPKASKAGGGKSAGAAKVDEAVRDAENLKKALRTESEILMDSLVQYETLLGKKLLTQEEYSAAMERLVAESPLFKLSPEFKDAEKDRADFTAAVDAETAAHRANLLELGKRVDQMKLETVFGERAAAVIEALAIARLSEQAAILEGFEGTDEMVARLREEVQLRSEILKIGNPEDKDYWASWLESAQEAMSSFDELAGSVVENFSNQFGGAFEKMIFDSESLGEAVSGLAEGMARSVVNALGQMAAQWIAYQVIQMAVGKTTAATEATALGLEASAMASMAGLAAFASTAAIPIVGPAAAPAAMAAALAVATPVAATVAGLSAAAAGARATGGPVSQNQTYLVGERGPELFVPNTNGAIVPNNKLGNGGGNITVNMIQNKERAGQTQERNDNGRREIDLFVADIMGDGPRAKAMRQAFGLQRRGY